MKTVRLHFADGRIQEFGPVDDFPLPGRYSSEVGQNGLWIRHEFRLDASQDETSNFIEYSEIITGGTTTPGKEDITDEEFITRNQAY